MRGDPRVYLHPRNHCCNSRRFNRRPSCGGDPPQEHGQGKVEVEGGKECHCGGWGEGGAKRGAAGSGHDGGTAGEGGFSGKSWVGYIMGPCLFFGFGLSFGQENDYCLPYTGCVLMIPGSLSRRVLCCGDESSDLGLVRVWFGFLDVNLFCFILGWVCLLYTSPSPRD